MQDVNDVLVVCFAPPIGHIFQYASIISAIWPKAVSVARPLSPILYISMRHALDESAAPSRLPINTTKRYILEARMSGMDADVGVRVTRRKFSVETAGTPRLIALSDMLHVSLLRRA